MERYKFVEELGRGGFGHVWLVRSTASGKKFVLKQINLHHSTKREQQAAFLEAKLLSTLHHSNIVSYLDSFYNSDGSFFIIMAFCEHGDLFNYIKNRNGKPFEEKQIVYWFIQLCLALKYLHDKNILHRDLKTKNLYLTRINLIKIGDFGISRVLNGRNDMAMTVIGTPTYMSPEILCSKPYNHKADIWGLGCCLYEMITLKQAFIAVDHSSLVTQVTSCRVRAIPNTWSEELIDIVLSMLSQDPAERPSVATILLNSFIRKNILAFLEEPLAIDSDLGAEKQENENLSVTQCRSMKAEVPGVAVKQNLNGISQHSHNNDLHRNNKNRNKMKVLATTVPDINGNGDGNDNSQHRSMPSQSKAVSHSSSNSATSSKENISPTNATNFAKNPKPVKKVAMAQDKSPGAHSIYANEIKRRGERSVQFLFNLTHNLKQARSSSAPSNACDVLTLPNVKQGFMPHNVLDGHMARSFFRSFGHSNAQPKPFSPSGKSDSPVLNGVDISNRSMVNNGNSNDIAFENDTIPGHVVLPEVSTILFSMRGGSADSELSEKTTCDKNIDNDLLVEILGCKKTNIAARQRRREKLKAKTLTKSAPASVESLPVIVSREV